MDRYTNSESQIVVKAKTVKGAAEAMFLEPLTGAELKYVCQTIAYANKVIRGAL